MKRIIKFLVLFLFLLIIFNHQKTVLAASATASCVDGNCFSQATTDGADSSDYSSSNDLDSLPNFNDVINVIYKIIYVEAPVVEDSAAHQEYTDDYYDRHDNFNEEELNYGYDHNYYAPSVEKVYYDYPSPRPVETVYRDYTPAPVEPEPVKVDLFLRLKDVFVDGNKISNPQGREITVARNQELRITGETLHDANVTIYIDASEETNTADSNGNWRALIYPKNLNPGKYMVDGLTSWKDNNNSLSLRQDFFTLNLISNVTQTAATQVQTPPAATRTITMSRVLGWVVAFVVLLIIGAIVSYIVWIILRRRIPPI